MKTKLSLFILLLSIIGYSQTAIEQFQSSENSQYSILSGAINQASAGANQNWDFTNLAFSSNTITDSYSVSGANSKIESTENGRVKSRIELTSANNILSLKKIMMQDVMYEYTLPIAIGQFPLAYNYTSTVINRAGEYGSPDGSGTIINTSDVTISVDAWGTLKVGSFNGSVTRLKIVQALNLSVYCGALSGAATHTSYYYYDANSTDLVFRTSTLQATLINPNGGGVTNVDETIIEGLKTYALSNSEYNYLDSQIKLAENPVNDILSFTASEDIKIQSVSIFDVTGRMVLESKNNTTSLNIRSLNGGLFLATLTTNKGMITKKFVKK